MSNESQVVSEATTSAVNPLLNQVDQTGDALKQSYELVTGPILQWAPNVIAMLVVLVVGYLVARLAGRAITAVCEKLGLQIAAERGGWIDSMKQVGIERTVPQIIGLIVFWLLMCVFLMAGCEILGLEAVSDTMQSLVAYIPKLFVAAVIVVVGLLLATFLRGVIATSTDRLGISYAQQLAAACYYILGLMVFIAAFEQLEIKFELLSYAILIGFAAVALGFGLAFGLGGRDVMSGILAGYYVRQRMHAGDRVNIAGFEGTIRDVGPVATIIETDEEGLLNRHSVPNIRMLNEAVR
ncbi:MAG: hypothetical protein CMJ81_24660 [Planctomycetaceae bacterium]|nr:hypothetical protein [Planctomycetaceae bacterium]MBP61275.1 hypothetical protein [Planctomycetaceae bacterium]